MLSEHGGTKASCCVVLKDSLPFSLWGIKSARVGFWRCSASLTLLNSFLITCVRTIYGALGQGEEVCRRSEGPVPTILHLSPEVAHGLSPL